MEPGETRKGEIVSFGFEKPWRKAFIDFPFRLHRKDEQWTPPIRKSLDFQLSSQYPFFRYGRSRNFLYRKGTETLGRISAILNPRARTDDKQVGYFAFFECVQDENVAGTLLDAACEWLRGQGAKIFRGPIQYSTYSSNRFVIKRGEEPPFFLEPYNPLYYPQFLERFGFRVTRRFYSSRTDRVNPDTHLSLQAREELYRKGFRVRTFEKGFAERDLRILYNLSEQCFARNFSFTSIPWEEFHSLHSGLVAFMDLDFLLFVFSPGGEPAGFVFGTPDYAKALRAMKGRNHLLSKSLFLWERRKTERAILKTLAVHPDHQGNRLGSLLAAHFHETATRKACQTILNSTIVKDNPTVFAMSVRDSVVFREYALFEME